MLHLLPPLPRLAPARLSELSELLPSLTAASARATASNRPSLARAYRLQHAAATREQASWLAALRAVRVRALVAVAFLLVAEAAGSGVLAVAALGFALGAGQAAHATVPAWQKGYVRMARKRADGAPGHAPSTID
jgi:hypothetical protein